MSVVRKIKNEEDSKYTYEEKVARGNAILKKRREKKNLILEGLKKRGKKNVYINPKWFDDKGNPRTDIKDEKTRKFIDEHLR